MAFSRKDITKRWDTIFSFDVLFLERIGQVTFVNVKPILFFRKNLRERNFQVKFCLRGQPASFIYLTNYLIRKYPFLLDIYFQLRNRIKIGRLMGILRDGIV